MTDFAAIDFETANNHPTSICSVGVVVVRHGEVVDRIHRLVRPEPNFYFRHFSEKIHGIYPSDTAGKPTFDRIWSSDIAPLISGLPLVAHNSAFDQKCLMSTLSHYNMPDPGYRFLCTYRAAKRAFPRLVNHQLHTVSAQCGFVLENHHNALADAEACAAIAMKIL